MIIGATTSNVLIELSTIVAFISGILGKLLYDEISRLRHQRIEEKQQKIEWYNELAQLANEIGQFAQSQNNMIKKLSDIYPEEYRRKMVEERRDKLNEKINQADRSAIAKFDAYFERLNKHHAEQLDDIEKEVQNSIYSLLSTLLLLRFTEPYEDHFNFSLRHDSTNNLKELNDDAIRVVSYCNQEVEVL